MYEADSEKRERSAPLPGCCASPRDLNALAEQSWAAAWAVMLAKIGQSAPVVGG
jgi:hypothetical protein